MYLSAYVCVGASVGEACPRYESHAQEEEICFFFLSRVHSGKKRERKEQKKAFLALSSEKRRASNSKQHAVGVHTLA